MMTRLILSSLAAACLVVPASANPDGAPWGSAEGRVNCTSCHFDNEPRQASAAIRLIGAPAEVTPGAVYALVIAFDKQDAPVAGFLATAKSGNTPAGAFEASQSTLEAKGHEVRSMAVDRGSSTAEWSVQWRAPPALSQPVDFHIAVNASNDDVSAFGDEIHLLKVTIPVSEFIPEPNPTNAGATD